MDDAGAYLLLTCGYLERRLPSVVRPPSVELFVVYIAERIDGVEEKESAFVGGDAHMMCHFGVVVHLGADTPGRDVLPSNSRCLW